MTLRWADSSELIDPDERLEIDVCPWAVIIDEDTGIAYSGVFGTFHGDLSAYLYEGNNG